jgi:glutamine amidotransferase
MEVLVVDYGAGNLTSVMKALRAVGASPVTGAGAEAFARAAAVVIPGVGHFSRTASIDESARKAVRTAIARGVPVLGICLGLQWLFEGSDEAPDVPGLGLFPGRCFSLGSDRGQTGVRPGSDQGQTGVQPGSDRGQTGARAKSADQGPIVLREWSDPGLTLVEPRSDPGLTPVEPRSDPGLTPLKVPHVGWNTVDPIGRPSRLLNAIPPSSFAYFTHTYAAPVVDDTVATTTHGEAFTAIVERNCVFGAQFHPEKSGHAGLRLLANFVRIAEGAR